MAGVAGRSAAGEAGQVDSCHFSRFRCLDDRRRTIAGHPCSLGQVCLAWHRSYVWLDCNRAGDWWSAWLGAHALCQQSDETHTSHSAERRARGTAFASNREHPILAVDLVLVSLAGVAVIGFFVNLYTLLQANAVDAYRGRIFGAFGVVQALTMLLGMVLASSLGDRIGIVPVLDMAASCDILAGLLAIFVVRNLNQPVPEPEQAVPT